MASKPLHLGWFMNFTPGEWDHPLSVGGSPWDGKFYVDMAQALERACFDYIMIEDTLMVSEAYGDSAEAALKHALQVPKHDPSPLAAIISAATRGLGWSRRCLRWPIRRSCWRGCAPRWTTSPAAGSAGTSSPSGEDVAAQNFGMDKLPPREQRYDMADEYVDLVCQLFDSWDPDAVVMDRETGTYADSPQGPADPFRGQVFKCRGPLNTVRSPQGRPVFVQAGGSPRGRAFAAQACGFDHRHRQRHRGHEGVSRRRARATPFVRAQSGRHQGAVPGLSDPGRDRRGGPGEARSGWCRRRTSSSARWPASPTVTDIDFSKFDLDQPLPRLTTNGEQGSLDKFAQWGSGKTLRQLAMERFGTADFGCRFRRLARHGGRADGRGDGGDWRRRLPDQHAVPAHQPAVHHRGDGRPGSGAATARSGADGVSGGTLRQALREF